MSKYTKIKIIDDGGMITFQTETSQHITSEPKGSVRISKFSLTGFSFERLITNTGIAYVDSADDILDATGTPYGVTFDAVRTILAAFFLNSSGGGSVAGAENGLYVSGGNVRLGGALLQDTDLIESGFRFVQIRTETIATADVTTVFRSNIANPFILQGWTENSLVRSMFVEDANGRTVTVGVASNNTDPSAAFLSAVQVSSSRESYIIVQPQEISQTIWRFGAILSRNSISGAQHLLDYKTQIQAIQPQTGSVVQVTRYSIEVDIATVTANQILATIAMEANCQYSVEAVINFRRTNLLGAGGARFFGGASRSSAFGNTLYSNNPNVVVLENVTGNPSFGHNIVATDYNILVSNSSAIKTRYSVVITITKTIITDTF